MDLKIYKKNESTVSIQCNTIISRELYNYFSCMSSNYRFDPRYKQGIWDGKLHFFGATTNELPIGLVHKLHEFARLGKYTIESDFKHGNNITREQFQKFIEYLKLPFPVRDYQFEAAFEACSNKHCNIHISTAGGKSLVIYIICRFLEFQKKKILLICPQIQLTEQMRGDFEDYGWDTASNCRTIYGGQIKNFSSTVSIATYQTVINEIIRTKEGKIMISEFDCIIVDECFISGTKIKTSDGYTNIEKINEGDFVYSYNIETNEYELKPVIKCYKNATISDKLIEIELEDGLIIKCSPNHKFYIKNNGKIELKQAFMLKEDDDIIEFPK